MLHICTRNSAASRSAGAHNAPAPAGHGPAPPGCRCPSPRPGSPPCCGNDGTGCRIAAPRPRQFAHRGAFIAVFAEQASGGQDHLAATRRVRAFVARRAADVRSSSRLSMFATAVPGWWPWPCRGRCTSAACRTVRRLRAARPASWPSGPRRSRPADGRARWRPQGLTRSGLAPVRSQASTTQAKASLISIQSRSRSVRPARASARSAAGSRPSAATPGPSRSPPAP